MQYVHNGMCSLCTELGTDLLRQMHLFSCRSRQSTPEHTGSLRAPRGGVASRYASVGAFGSQPKSSGASFTSPGRSGVFAPPPANAGTAKVGALLLLCRRPS